MTESCHKMTIAEYKKWAVASHLNQLQLLIIVVIKITASVSKIFKLCILLLYSVRIYGIITCVKKSNCG
jgi:hypothetical protein